MDFSQFGAKELYDVVLRVRNQELIGTRSLEAGEPLATFEKIQYGTILEKKKDVHAKGGTGNQVLVSWVDTQEVAFNFSQGVFTKTDLALLSNANIEQESEVVVPTIEYHKIDENGKVYLDYEPMEGHIFVFHYGGIDKVGKVSHEEWEIEGSTITFKSSEYNFSTVKIIYEFTYTNKNDTIYVGQPLINGYLELTGKTTLRNDTTGKEHTAILRVPKFKIVSDFSITLGTDVPPLSVAFRGVGYPVGPRKQERVMEIVILDENIDG